MGTEWRISFGAGNKAWEQLQNSQSEQHLQLRNSIEQELERINSLMSTWDPQSALSLFNASPSTKPIPWHTDSLTVLNAALAVSKATEGAFDVTRGKVFELWGFSANEPSNAAPSEDEIKKALLHSGWESVLVGERNHVSKRYSELSIDLSSIAKGFAVDQLGAVLESQGVLHYVVNIGGEIRVRGERSENNAWRIGVEQPDTKVASGLELGESHLATSGSYRNVRIVDGQRISHIVDGRTGKPITHDLVAATVLHESTLLADAWSTAYMVIGAEQAQVHAQNNGIAVQLTRLKAAPVDTSKPPEFTVWQSPEWLKYPSVHID